MDQASRARLLALGEGNFLPGDLALDAQMAGVSVIAVGTVLVDSGHEARDEQPDVLTDLLAQEREQAWSRCGAAFREAEVTLTPAVCACTRAETQRPAHRRTRHDLLVRPHGSAA